LEEIKKRKRFKMILDGFSGGKVGVLRSLHVWHLFAKCHQDEGT
jgi:hypothetical protein